MKLIDTHVHLNFSTFEADLEAVCLRWREAGVVHLVHSCVEPGEYASIRAIADRFPEISFAIGLHPLDADRWTPEMGDRILTAAKADRRVVAIGELGLDLYKANNEDWQKQVLRSQLELARALDLPIIVHCREAARPLRELLEEFWRDRGPLRGVMHCWSGTPEETRWFLDLGFHISFSGIVTFKTAQSVRDSATVVPSDRLLIETDCPFLAPVPRRGKRNEPAYVAHVAEQVAALRGVSVEQIARETAENACQLFRLALPVAVG